MASKRPIFLFLILALCLVEFAVFWSSDLFATSDFTRYVQRYESAYQLSAWAHESGFYKFGNWAAQIIGYFEYQFLLCLLLVCLYWLAIFRKAPAAFIGAAIFPATFIGFDAFFSASRSTVAALIFLAVYRFGPAIAVNYFVHLGVTLQSLVVFAQTRWRIVSGTVLAALLALLLFDEIYAVARLYYDRFALYEGEGALRGAYNGIFIGYYALIRLAFRSDHALLVRTADLAFALYLAAALISVPYSYRLAYFPIIVAKFAATDFRFGTREFGLYLIVEALYVLLVYFRIT